LNVLRSKLIQLEIEKSNKLKQAMTIGGGGSNWGNQIKTITLQPYCLVKDHRTGWETSIVDSYMNGDKQVTDAMTTFLKFEIQEKI
jgi:peptide chain release factor 2